MERPLSTIPSDLNRPQPDERWTFMEQIDRFRLWRGSLLEEMGWGPKESPSRIVFEKPALTLRAYTEPDISGPVVLLVPAPIKRAYLWDLAPGASVVQQFVRGGLRVYLAQW